MKSSQIIYLLVSLSIVSFAACGGGSSNSDGGEARSAHLAGVFLDPLPMQTNDATESVAPGDVDGDGYLDIVNVVRIDRYITTTIYPDVAQMDLSES